MCFLGGKQSFPVRNCGNRAVNESFCDVSGKIPLFLLYPTELVLGTVVGE